MDDVSPRTVGVDSRANQIDPLTQLLAASILPTMQQLINAKHCQKDSVQTHNSVL